MTLQGDIYGAWFLMIGAVATGLVWLAVRRADRKLAQELAKDAGKGDGGAELARRLSAYLAR